MQTQNRYFDDFAKLLTNAAGVAKGVGQELETIIRQQAERVMANFDFVPRDEYEVLKARVAALEEQIASAKGSKGARTAAKRTKSAAKKKTASKSKTSR